MSLGARKLLFLFNGPFWGTLCAHSGHALGAHCTRSGVGVGIRREAVSERIFAQNRPPLRTLDAPFPGPLPRVVGIFLRGELAFPLMAMFLVRIVRVERSST